MPQDGYKPETREASIVALGKFNPAIFQPQWYGALNLIRAEEAAKARIEVIHNDVTVFSTEWFRAEITQDRFAMSTPDPTKFLPLRDLVLSTFRILEHTLVSAFGFNSVPDFAIGTPDAWHAFGHHYAPKHSWSGVLVEPGLRLLVMEGTRQDSSAKRVFVQIEPSSKVPHGVRIAFNEHYELNPQDSPQNRMRRFLDTVGAAWEPFLQYTDAAAQHLLQQAETNNNG
jgi:hypothetical protein